MKKNKLKKIIRRIIKLLGENPNKLYNIKQIISNAELSSNKSDIQAILDNLVAKKLIALEDYKYKYKPELKYAIGKIDMTASGSGYVECEDLENDIYIPSRNVGKAFDNDIVKVDIYKKKNNNKYEGRVMEIVERSKTKFVGKLQSHDSHGFVVPDNKSMQIDFYIKKSNLNNAKDGQKVIVEMLDWPNEVKNPYGKIIEVLGMPGEHEVEMHSILADFDLPYKFPLEVESEADNINIKITDSEIAKRRDMRGTTTFTIDPHDAKDFDDALSFKKLENGNWEIGIHIADVTHYVRPNTLLEEEAYARATSVYLVDRVVPMLPEVLSNNVCSLRPNEEKLTFSAIFEIDDDANILEQWFGRTVILSDRRFSYKDAQDVIETKSGDLSEEILKLDEIAKKLRKKRMKKGAISFDKTEVKFNLDENSKPVGIYFKEMKDSNHLIEEFMLLANKKVAQFIGKKKNGKPSHKTFIYRIHDDPDPEKLLAVKDFVRQFGYDVKTKNRNEISSSLNTLLKNVKGKGEANVIETLVLRSMSKAKYSTNNIGHYGLAFDYYSHFTSPIRRYPDMIAHRLLQYYLDGKKSPNRVIYEEQCEHSSQRERLATQAERESTKYMQVKYMEDHVGEVFKGVISGATQWGIFVELSESHCEGMIRLSSIKDDHYVFDESKYCVEGIRLGKTYGIGDEVEVVLKDADLEKRQLNFALKQ